ncbi:hypothetical protein [Streptomyces sp. NPDC002057]|uniref:hypothetical protein n=1 Tax=Streptomyces sp. NPDC002057 TaxID=3154664 RepID=UPI0033186E80
MVHGASVDPLRRPFALDRAPDMVLNEAPPVLLPSNAHLVLQRLPPLLAIEPATCPAGAARAAGSTSVP